MIKKNTIAAIVPAAGVGSRMQLNFPKQYLKILNRTILEHTVAKLTSVSELSHLVIAIGSEDPIFPTLSFSDNRIQSCIGGNTRAHSVFNAMCELQRHQPDWVLVHDAARPLVLKDDIEQLIASTKNEIAGGILASKVKDTIKQGEDYVEHTVPRDSLWSALTPQLFRFDVLFEALQEGLEQCPHAITDEASAIERKGLPVKLVAGRSDNIKITTPEDFELAQFILMNQLNKVLQ
ncbi:2-C-methyl-D-erythritol 4-phosphate cytidylyltransferase [Pseudoalteromonas luteoviolacea B = ATCC 29581]|nr:2-C-methyl-D-erythritol 4-phosphate cytidylyltransferase [Pseudoalteromonas luteoviolacea B = ATCC 29581]